MKLIALAFIAMLTVLAFTSAPVVADPPGNGGGGICPNPNAPDDDGDGIPNGQDPDYVPPCDGSNRHRGPGYGYRWMLRWGIQPAYFGGIWVGTFGWGPGDGTGNGGVGPQDGTGYGPGPLHNDQCDRSGRQWRYGGDR